MHDAHVAVGGASQLGGIQGVCAKVPHRNPIPKKWKADNSRGAASRQGRDRCCAPTKITRSSSREWARELRPFLPGSEVTLLFGSELVEPVAHGIELEAAGVLGQVLGDSVELRRVGLVGGAEGFGGGCLAAQG